MCVSNIAQAGSPSNRLSALGKQASSASTRRAGSIMASNTAQSYRNPDVFQPVSSVYDSRTHCTAWNAFFRCPLTPVSSQALERAPSPSHDYSIKYIGISEGQIGILSRRVPLSIESRGAGNSSTARGSVSKPCPTHRSAEPIVRLDPELISNLAAAGSPSDRDGRPKPEVRFLC
jgi:hypothetical protein